MNKYDLIFLVVRETSTYFHSVDEDAAASTLVYYMTEAGLRHLTAFPSTEEDKYAGSIYKQFTKFLESNTAPIFCISCWTSTYAVASDFAGMVKKTYPDALIVAGGIHFNSMEETEYALKSGVFDIIFRGGGESFLEFIKLSLVDKKLKINKKNGELDIIGDFICKGACYLKNGEIQNKGRGSFKFPLVPLAGVTEDGIDIRIMLNDSCPNACDYCFIQPSVTSSEYWPTLINWVTDTAVEFKKQYGQSAILSLSDSAPFNRKNRSRTIKYLRKQNKRVTFDGMNVFVDPVDLDEDFYKIVEEFNINTFFIGRDRVEADNFVGRKCNGQLRSSGQLNQELDSIFDFMEYLNTLKGKLTNEIYLGYIISPYEKVEYSRKLIDELTAIAMRSSELDNIKVQSNIFLLNPYPGTKVAKRAEGEFIPMRYFYHPYPNVWVGKDTVNIYLEVIRLIIAKMFCNNNNISFYKPMLELAHSLQFNTDYNYKLIDDIENTSLRSFASEIIEKIFSMGLGEENSLDDYLNNIVTLYYIGCMVSVVMNKPELLKYKNLYERIVKGDQAVSYLKKDLDLIKKYTLEGGAPVLEKYVKPPFVCAEKEIPPLRSG